MGEQMTIGQLETAINRYKGERPVDNYVLPVELRLMADLYGRMIYFGLDVADLSAETTQTQAALTHWRDVTVAPLRAELVVEHPR